MNKSLKRKLMLIMITVITVLQLRLVDNAYALDNDNQINVEFNTILTDNQEEITVTANPSDPSIAITGIELPNGNVVTGSNATFVATENQVYSFIINYDETILELDSTPSEETIGSDLVLNPTTRSSQKSFTYQVSEIKPADEILVEPVLPTTNIEDTEETIIDEETVTEDITEETILDEETVTEDATEETILDEETEEIILNINEADFVFDPTSSTITDYIGVNKAVVIPITIDGQDVLHIGQNAFNNKQLTALSFSEGSKIETIADQAFYQNNTLTGELTLPNTLISTGALAFANTNLNKITTGASLRTIGRGTFSLNNSLSEVVLNEGLETIENQAFSSLPSLRTINIPSTVRTIGTQRSQEAFANNPNLDRINIAKFSDTINGAPWGAVRATTIWSNYLQSNDNDWFFTIDASNNATIRLYSGDETAVSLPNTFTDSEGNEYPVISFSSNAFYSRRNITSIDLSANQTITTIPNSSFSNFRSLNTVVLPKQITTIETDAFAFTIALKNINLSTTNLETISRRSFNQTGLVNLDLSKTQLRSIGQDAFSDAESLNKVVLPNTIRSISRQAFSGSSLKEINLPEGLTSIGEAAFSGTQLKEIVIPASVTSYGSLIFHLTSLEKVTLPHGLTRIPPTMFSNTPFLTKIYIPSTVETIGASAFANSGLKSIVIPSSVTRIEQNVFSQTNSLTKITILKELNTIPQITSGTINWGAGGPSNKVIWDPPTRVGDWIFSKSNNTVYGYLGSSPNPVIPEEFEINDIKYRTENLDAGTFNNNRNIESITFASGIKEIQNRSFLGTTSLRTVVLNEGLSKIDHFAFQGATSLTSINIPDSVTEINQGAFNNTGLTSITISKNLKEISEELFKDSTNLTTVNLPVGLLKIAKEAFSNTNIREINLPITIEEISSNVFNNTPITNIQIPREINDIDDLAFANSNIQNIHILQLENDKDFHNKQPFGASQLTTVNFIGDVISFDHNIIKTEEPNVRIIKISAFLSDENITKIILPDNTEIILNDLNFLRNHEYQVTTNGIYTFRAESTDSTKNTSYQVIIDDIGTPTIKAKDISELVVTIDNLTNKTELLELLEASASAEGIDDLAVQITDTDFNAVKNLRTPKDKITINLIATNQGITVIKEVNVSARAEFFSGGIPQLPKDDRVFYYNGEEQTYFLEDDETDSFYFFSGANRTQTNADIYNIEVFTYDFNIPGATPPKFARRFVDIEGNDLGNPNVYRFEIKEAPLSLKNLNQVIKPVVGERPVTTTIDNPEYRAEIRWLGDPEIFVQDVAYKAVVTITPKTNYTINEILANSFDHNSAALVNYLTNSNQVTLIFPKTTNDTLTTVTNTDLTTVLTKPITGGTPVNNIDNDQYQGSVTWNEDHLVFEPNKVYTATINLSAKDNFTFDGISENSFTHDNATSVTQSENSGIITIVFEPTEELSINATISLNDLTNFITVPTNGATPSTTVFSTDEYTGTISWLNSPTTFLPNTVYTAIVTLTVKEDFTLVGIPANFFTHNNAASVTNDQNSGTVTITFPATASPPTSGGGGGGSRPNRVINFRLTFNTNGGTPIESVLIRSGNNHNLSSYVTTREGFIFDGWYLDQNLQGSRISNLQMTSNQTIYAKWIEVTPEVTPTPVEPTPVEPTPVIPQVTTPDVVRPEFGPSTNNLAWLLLIPVFSALIIFVIYKRKKQDEEINQDE